MADSNLSGLPEAAAPSNTDLFYTVQGATPLKQTWSALVTAINTLIASALNLVTAVVNIAIATSASATDGLLLKTSSTATAGNPKWSPVLRLEGQAFSGGTSWGQEMRIYNEVVSITQSKIHFQISTGSGAPSYSDFLLYDSSTYALTAAQGFTVGSVLTTPELDLFDFGSGFAYQFIVGDSVGLTADHVLILDLQNGDRTLTLGGDLTLTGANQVENWTVNTLATVGSLQVTELKVLDNAQLTYYTGLVPFSTTPQTMDRYIRFDCKDGFRTVTLGGNLTLTGANQVATWTVTGAAVFAAGTVGTPLLRFSGDTTSGFYRIGANNIGVSISGAKVLDIASTGLAVTGALSATGTISDSIGNVRIIPQNSRSAAYTTVAADSGKHILHPSADTTARTFTIDSNANVPYAIGTAITFVNQNSAGTVTIAITTDTMRLAGAGTTGNRTLAANGIATAVKITATEWIISGTGLT